MTHSLYLYSSYLLITPGYLVLPPLLPCYSLDFLWVASLFSTFPLSTQVSPVSDTASTSLVRFLALLRLSSALPDPILVPVPIIVSTLISTIALVSVPAPVPVPILCSSRSLHPRPRPVPVPILRSRVHLNPLSRSHLYSHPRPRSILPFPRIRLLPRYYARVQPPGLAKGAVGCPQVLPPVCRDDDACGIKVPTTVLVRFLALLRLFCVGICVGIY